MKLGRWQTNDGCGDSKCSFGDAGIPSVKPLWMLDSTDDSFHPWIFVATEEYIYCQDSLIYHFSPFMMTNDYAIARNR